MLSNAGYSYDCKPADIDEEAIIEKLEKEKLEKIPLILAQEKAKFISSKNKEKYIIGSDQVLIFKNKIYSKAKNKNEAIERLKVFSNQAHLLISAVSVFKDGKEIFNFTDQAELKMKKLDDEFIEEYCNKAGDNLTNCVGCYALESVGVRLFEEIKGDYFTILGMPLLPLVKFFDSEGVTL